MELVRIDDLDDLWDSRVQLEFEDGGGPGQNARLTHPLEVATEYLVLISGSDDFQRGLYTLTLTADFP